MAAEAYLDPALAAFRDMISKFHTDEEKYQDEMMEELKGIVEKDISVIVPVEVDESKFVVDEEASDETAMVLKEDAPVTFLKLTTGGQYTIFPAFTSMEEVEKGPRSSATLVSLKQLFMMVLKDDTSVGIVIDPWGGTLSISIDGCVKILSDLGLIEEEDEEDAEE